MIAAQSLALFYGAKAILRDVSLALRPGELVALIGPNGAGKSTLLTLLAGQLRPQRGQVLLDGKDLRRIPSQDLARRRAMMLQHTPLVFGYSVKEVVKLGRFAHRGHCNPIDDERACAEAMALAGIEKLASRDFRALSGGEQQRVHFARCFAQIWGIAARRETRLLLLDEPLANLDLAYQQAVLCASRRAAQEGAAVLVSIHDPNLAAQADRVIVLHEGVVQADGPPAIALSPDLLQRLYGLPLIALAHPQTGRPVLLPAS